VKEGKEENKKKLIDDFIMFVYIANVRLDSAARDSFEREIELLLDIANAKSERARTEQAFRRCRSFARAAGTRAPSRQSCLRAVCEQGAQARALLSTWLESRRDYRKWRAENPKLYDAVAATVSKTSYSLWPADDSQEEPGLRRLYAFTSNILGEFCVFEVHWALIDVLRNPLRNDIASCDRCGSWFLNRSGHRNKRFCKRRCAVASAVIHAQRKRRQREREHKLKEARIATGDCCIPSANWKEWVSRRTGLGVGFLTRAVNRGELKPPSGA
jgi:hypothetical protein